MWRVSVLVSCLILCSSRLTRSRNCHISPNNSSSLAVPGSPPLRLSCSPVVEMPSWGTPKLAIDDYRVNMAFCWSQTLVTLLFKTVSINITDESLCRLVLTSQIRCNTEGQTTSLGLWGSIEEFGSCKSQTWEGHQGVEIKLNVPWTLLVNQTTKFQCLMGGSTLFNFTISNIGCPLGYWGNQCDKNCSCPLATQECHTTAGGCVQPIRGNPTTQRPKMPREPVRTTTTTTTKTTSTTSHSEYNTSGFTTRNRQPSTTPNHGERHGEASVGKLFKMTISALMVDLLLRS